MWRIYFYHSPPLWINVFNLSVTELGRRLMWEEHVFINSIWAAKFCRLFRGCEADQCKILDNSREYDCIERYRVKREKKNCLHLEEKEKLSYLLQGLDRSEGFHQLNHLIKQVLVQQFGFLQKSQMKLLTTFNCLKKSNTSNVVKMVTLKSEREISQGKQTNPEQKPPQKFFLINIHASFFRCCSFI